MAGVSCDGLATASLFCIPTRLKSDQRTSLAGGPWMNGDFHYGALRKLCIEVRMERQNKNKNTHFGFKYDTFDLTQPSLSN